MKHLKLPLFLLLIITCANAQTPAEMIIKFGLK